MTWMPYAKRVEQAGGKLHCAPQDIPGVGRWASVEDPQGAAFLLFKGSLDYAPPRPPLGTPGTVGWNELSANDEKIRLALLLQHIRLETRTARWTWDPWARTESSTTAVPHWRR